MQYKQKTAWPFFVYIANICKLIDKNNICFIPFLTTSRPKRAPSRVAVCVTYCATKITVCDYIPIICSGVRGGIGRCSASGRQLRPDRVRSTVCLGYVANTPVSNTSGIYST